MKSRRQRGLPILHSESRTSCDSSLQTVVRAEKSRLTVARRRRFFTVFPCAESLVIVDDAVKFPHAPLIAMLLTASYRKNDRAGRAGLQPRHNLAQKQGL